MTAGPLSQCHRLEDVHVCVVVMVCVSVYTHDGVCAQDCVFSVRV